MALSGSRTYLALVAVYGAAIIALGMLPAFGLYFPKFPYQDVYIPYLFVAGPAVFVAGYWAEAHCCVTVSALLPPRAAGWVCVVVVPGIVDFVLGSVQWVLIAALVRKMSSIGRHRGGFLPAQGIDDNEKETRKGDIHNSQETGEDNPGHSP